MKIFFRRIHLYLSLAAGLAILIACLTGAILVFEKDLQMAFNKDRYYVDPAANRLPLDSLKTLAVNAFPGHKVSGIKLYADAERSAELQVTPAKKGEDKGKKDGTAAVSGQ